MQPPTPPASNPEVAAKPALFCEGIFLNRVDTTVWLSAEEAAEKLGAPPAEIQKRGGPWQESPERYRIRYKLALDAGKLVQRFFQPDVEAALNEEQPEQPSAPPRPPRTRAQ